MCGIRSSASIGWRTGAHRRAAFAQRDFVFCAHRMFERLATAVVILAAGYERAYECRCESQKFRPIAVYEFVLPLLIRSEQGRYGEQWRARPVLPHFDRSWCCLVPQEAWELVLVGAGKSRPPASHGIQC